MPYEEKDVAEDRAAAYEMIRKTDPRGVPVFGAYVGRVAAIPPGGRASITYLRGQQTLRTEVNL